MRLRIAAAVVAVFCLATAAHAADGAKAPDKAKIEALLKQSGVPSVSIAVIQGGEVAFTAAYGKRAPSAPATPATLYNIASLTKPITAEVVLRLASRGTLSLDEPMSVAWVDPDIAGDPRTAQLTARLALSHRTGFPNWRGKTGLSFVRSPGEYGYSGEGFGYVAHYAELKAGMDLEASAQRLLFAPAGMKDTAYTDRPLFHGRIAQPFDDKGNWLQPHIAHKAVAADLVYTTAADYARFMLQVMNDAALTSTVAADRLKVWADMKGKPCAPGPACPDAVGMGLGWQVVRFGSRIYLMHTGKDDGVFTLAYLSPTHRTGVVILTNSDNGTKMVLPLLKQLAIDPEFTAFLESGA